MFYSWHTSAWVSLHGRPVLSPALLVTGRAGTGKNAFVTTVAKALLCGARTAEGYPCGICTSCRWFEQGTHPDFRLLEPEEPDAEMPAKRKAKRGSARILIEQVRALQDFVNLASHQGRAKVVLIRPAEALNLAAANALLKTLEEPPPGTHFLLLSHRPGQLLPTIRSRCLALPLPMPDRADALQWLRAQGLDSPESRLAEVGFAPLTALEEQDDARRRLRQRFLELVAQPAALDPLAAAESMEGGELPTTVGWLQRWNYDLLRAHQCGDVRYHPELQDSIRRLAAAADPLRLARYDTHLVRAQRESHHTLNPRLFLEMQWAVYRDAMVAERGRGDG